MKGIGRPECVDIMLNLIQFHPGARLLYPLPSWVGQKRFQCKSKILVRLPLATSLPLFLAFACACCGPALFPSDFTAEHPMLQLSSGHLHHRTRSLASIMTSISRTMPLHRSPRSVTAKLQQHKQICASPCAGRFGTPLCVCVCIVWWLPLTSSWHPCL